VTSLSINLVQTQLRWEDPEANRAHFRSLLADAPEADLTVLPEMFSTGFSMNSASLAENMSGTTVEFLCEQAERLNTAITGSVIIQDQGNFYNRLIWCVPGQSPQYYDKRHLFRMANEHDHYQPGDQRLVVELNGFRVCPMICYDLRFPAWVRNQQDYDVLLFVANWPAARRMHWMQLLQARAIENQAYVIGVNRIGDDGHGIPHCGDSMAINFQGEVLIDLRDQDEIATAALDMAPLQSYREAFPAHLDADDFQLTL